MGVASSFLLSACVQGGLVKEEKQVHITVLVVLIQCVCGHKFEQECHLFAEMSQRSIVGMLVEKLLGTLDAVRWLLAGGVASR